MAIRRVSWNVDDLKYSSKAKRLLEIVEDAKDDDRKIIVFSYFLDTIARSFLYESDKWFAYIGKKTRNNR